MKIHEFQAKELLRKYSVPVPNGRLCYNVAEAISAAPDMKKPLAVKAQIHAGGRSRGGGVLLAHNDKELEATAESILGMTLVTQQTGNRGQTVRKILVEEGLSIQQEFYLSLVVDRISASIAIISSREGGMDIEDIAESSPEEIFTTTVDPLLSIQHYHLRDVGFTLGLTGGLHREFCRILKQLYHLFIEYDLSMLELNPLVITDDNEIIALDAKISFDDNALFRHPDIVEMHDPDEEDPAELEAAKHNLNYINLEGNVGNMVNGAGLAMATMDMIKQAGAQPANFLDVGGTANAAMVEKGFELILADPNVQAVFINIFGGIFRCDVLANGIVQAASKLDIKVPVVVRMEGTNVGEGRKILSESGFQFINAIDLSEAAEKIAQVVC